MNGILVGPRNSLDGRWLCGSMWRSGTIAFLNACLRKPTLACRRERCPYSVLTGRRFPPPAHFGQINVHPQHDPEIPIPRYGIHFCNWLAAIGQQCGTLSLVAAGSMARGSTRSLPCRYGRRTIRRNATALLCYGQRPRFFSRAPAAFFFLRPHQMRKPLTGNDAQYNAIKQASILVGRP